MPRRIQVILPLLIAVAIGIRSNPVLAGQPKGADDPWNAISGPGEDLPKIPLPSESSGPTLPLVPAREHEPPPMPPPVDPEMSVPWYPPHEQKPLMISETPEATSLRDPSRFVRSSIPTVLTQPSENSVFPDNSPLAPPKGFACDACDPSTAGNPRSHWPEAWGVVGMRLFYDGDRMAPNGVPYNALFDLNCELYIGLLPNKKLYVFGLTDFWGEKATAGVTNTHQGQFDFSKREWDFTVGAAWNYCESLELRVLGYGLNNLNRGNSLADPAGFNDGIGIENRWYLPAADVDPYDIGRLSFLSVGWLPNSTLTGGDGRTFKPGLFARAYLTWDLPSIRSYLFVDGTYEAEQSIEARLLLFDTGLAVRPWLSLQNLEFRVGVSGVYDVKVNNDRSLGYLGMRVQF